LGFGGFSTTWVAKDLKYVNSLITTYCRLSYANSLEAKAMGVPQNYEIKRDGPISGDL
jgi:hypothetical protein